MANKTLKIDLQFNANVKEAQRQMQQLQQSLSQLATSQPMTSFSLTPQLKEAQRSAMDLKIALNNAMNVDTGRLNLNKFQSELNRSGKSIQQYAQQLQALGPSGVRAFQQVAQAVAQADTKMFNLSGGAKKLMDTLGNTVRWQLTSSAIHGVMSAFSDTISYAKELDTSLNNIRIVTGKSADQMARFAKEANSMAKQLSTTTTKYTDASLIYYQQGLNDKEVKERTDTTVKLANVTGETAEQVSEWMTSIWNNFDDGTMALERYADMIAKLGAATASSADEIATGLEKFAAVADTVGLSYEYATSALATVTAETRQSADVVGTAFKTLFARIEGLKFGETLEDGTDLNQYSLALQTVGVNIKDANGELKDMDTILDQTGARWQTLSKDQQIALAQQVAGIRQYNQFMALMENWDVMQNNLKLVEQSNGALEEQNRIYEESMAASQERMKAAGEELKALIIGGDDLIPLYNFAGGALEVITELLEAFGGLPTIILGVATALTKLYQPQIASFASQLGVGFTSAFSSIGNALKGKGFTPTSNFKTDTAMTAANMAASVASTEQDSQAQFTQSLTKIDIARIENESKLNEAAKQRIEWLRKELEMKQQLVLEGEKAVQAANEEVEAKGNALINKGYQGEDVRHLQGQSEKLGQLQAHGSLAQTMVTQAQTMGGATMNAQSREDFKTNMSKQLDEMKSKANALGGSVKDISFKPVEDSLQNFVNTGKGLDDLLNKIKELNSELNKAGQGTLNTTIGEMAPEQDEAILRKSSKTYDGIAGAAGLQENDSIDTAVSHLDKIDENKFSSQTTKDYISKKKSQAKTLQEENKALKDQDKWMRDNKKSAAEYKEAVEKNDRAIKKFNKDTAKSMSTLKKNSKTLKTNIRSTKEYENGIKDVGRELKDFSSESTDAAKSAEGLEEATTTLNKEAADMEENIRNGGSSFTHWSDNFANGLNVAMQFAMGLSMITSAAEQMGKALGSNNHSMGDWISNVSSMLMGITMLLPSMISLTKGIYSGTQKLITNTKATIANIIAKRAEKIATEDVSNSEKKGILIRAKETGSKIISGMASIGKAIAENPVKGIAVAAAALPFLIAAGAMAVNFNSGKSDGEKEAKQEEVSKGTESLEAINENQELAESVTDLTEEYNALRNAGESTADVLEDMREKIPQLIDSYKELAKTMGTNIDTSELEKAYEVFEKTGDTSLLEKAQEKLDKDIKSKEKTIAQSTIDNASDLVMDAAFKGQGHKDGKSYTYHMGDVGLSAIKEKQVQDIFAEELNDLWKKDSDGAGGQFTISDYENEGELIDAYNKMLAARDRLVEAGLDDTDYYKELNGEIKQMAESMPDLINAQQQLFDIQKEEALKDEQAFNSKIGLGSIGSIEEFEANKDKLIAKIREETEWTEAQAEAYLMATEAYGGYAEAADFFSKSGLGFNKDASKQTIKDIKEWFAGLPEEDRTLAMTIDYTSVATKEDAAAALEEAREKMRIAAATKEATELGADADTFETYAEILQLTNKNLKDNEANAYDVAAANVRVNKGLEDLSKNWSENLEKITKNTKGSYEYAEGISEISKSLETMFGVKPSVNFVETHLQDIEDMLNGDKETFEKLQDSLAEDYVTNMLIEPEIVFDGNTDAVYNEAETIRDALQGALNELGDLEIGENIVLSDKYTKVLQEALDAGQITQKQLEEAFRIKGYDLDFKTKTVPGPKTHYKRTYDLPWPLGQQVVEYDEETEMTVPLINGADANVSESGNSGGGGAKLTATRTADNTTLNPTKTEENAEKKQDRIDNLKDEKDRYHEINEIISDTERELDKLGKAKDKAFGASKIALMDKEIAKQKELIENNKQLLKEAEKYYQQDRSKLLSSWDVQLDSTGRISNYEEIQQRYIDRLNANAGNEKLYEDIEEEYEAFKDAAEKYEESLNKVEEQAEKVNDELDALYERNLEKIEYKVQIKVDIADDDKAYLDFLMQKVEDDAFAAAEAISYLGKEAQLTLDKIKANEEGIAEVERALAAGEITPEQAVEKMREYRDNLVDLNADLLEIRQTVQDKLTEAFESWNEEIERGITKLEHYGSVLENYKNIIDIIGKDMLGISDETMSNLSKAQIANANNVIRATKAQLDANNSTLEKMRQSRAEAEARGDEESVKEWDKQIKVAEEKSQELAATLQEALSNSLQLAADDFALTVEQIADSFSKAVSGIYDDIEDMREGWDRMQEVADRYLETYEKTYEISKLNRKIQDSIDKTDNIASQKELRDLQNEMYEMTKDGQQLSKYDLEYLQKKYDLLVTEQAFKDAQNAKSVVRLQRDSEGNFGYVYTADQGTVDNAEQNYEDKLYAFQEYTHKMDEELAEMYISVQEQAYERMQAAAEMYGEGTEAFERERQKILEQYNIDMGYITDEYEKLTNRNLDINERFNAGVADTYEKTFISSIVPQYQSFEQLYDETTTQCEVSCARLDEAIILLQQTFDKQLELAGQDLDRFEETANKELEKVQDDSSITADKVEDMASRMDIALSSSISAVENFQTTYSAQMQIIRNANQQTIESVNSLIQKYQEMINKSNEAAKVDLSVTGNATASTSGGGASPSGSPNTSVPLTNSSEKSNDFKWTKVATHNYNGENFEALGKDDKGFTGYLYRRTNGEYVKSGSVSRAFTERELDNLKWKIVNSQVYNGKGGLYVLASALEDNKKSGVYKGQEWLIPINNLNKLWSTGWFNFDLKGFGGAGAGRSFDTGGYTGEWGPEGRLAMLHQKEIVLNAHDTENFLAAIGIVRDISDQIEKNAIVMQYQNQLANYRASIGNSGETLQQEVHITAEFPNATDHNEIEEAFKNLTNLASQYANRK